MATLRGFLSGISALPLFRRLTTTEASPVIEVTPGTELAPVTQPSEVRFEGGVHDIDGLTIPAGSMFTRVGGPVTLRIHGTLVVLDDFILSPGFTFDAADPAADIPGLRVAGKRTQLYAPKFTRFGNKGNTPYALIYDSLDPSTWADWNHLYSPHFEFVYGGMMTTSPSNVMVSNLVARGNIGLGGAVRSHMSGSPAGAPVRVNGIWTAHCEGPAIQFTKDPDVTRPGGNIITNWTNEPGAGRTGTAALVESDGNYFGGALVFVGGDIGFAWGDVSDNIVDSTVVRNRQGGIGPPVDTGPVGDQIYR